MLIVAAVAGVCGCSSGASEPATVPQSTRVSGETSSEVSSEWMEVIQRLGVDLTADEQDCVDQASTQIEQFETSALYPLVRCLPSVLVDPLMQRVTANAPAASEETQACASRALVEAIAEASDEDVATLAATDALAPDLASTSRTLLTECGLDSAVVDLIVG